MRRLVALAIALAACTAHAPEPPALDACDRAEARIRELDCHERGRPLWATPGGVRWGEMCRELAANGRDTRPDCVANMASCESLTANINAAPEAPCAR